MIKAVAALLAAGVGYISLQNLGTSENDIFVDGIVYLKKDSLPFTGRLTIDDPPHAANYEFCKGVPCGSWEYRFNGDLVHKGTHIDPSLIPKETLALLSSGPFVLDHWQEGELPSIPYAPYLSVEILKPLSFFAGGKEAHEQEALELASAFAAVQSGVQYDLLTIYYRSDFYQERRFIRYEFDLRTRPFTLKGIEAN